ncbi:serine/threonine protein kinase [Reticulibacter mediterranei]|uniref:Serine/threonine protein kinase n=1 Tax=Reticulibacter mediterranei TaxID=2778369 RepID=A0A8J3J0U7_9CHLR|nr:serine/threonine protein kinase [Reticulibacter mediterranei]
MKATQTFLSRPQVRLLTLTGTPGVGKTRLGLQVASELRHTFADGVCFVSLAPLRDPDLVLPTLAQALSLPEARDRSPLEHLQACLHDKHLLLLLDNFEQVTSAAVLLVELLQTCSDLKALVTSRALLHVRGEYEVQVSPLDLPDPKQDADVELLRGNAAMTLFTQRAQALVPDFAPTGTNAQIIAAICTRLDGLPLAIELAAARVKLLSPQQLLSRLQHRFDLLTNGAQDLPVRQQTLRATLQWSYELLSPEEQRLFQLLSVFVGGCTLEAVEAVCAILDKKDAAHSVMEGVASLVDKSLLQQHEQEGGESRLLMLETIREYGWERLAESGQTEVTQQAHVDYYLLLAEKKHSEREGFRQTLWLDQTTWMQRLDQEYQNLRATLSWTQTQKALEQLLRLASALSHYWVKHCAWSEGRQWLERALAGTEGVMTTERGEALAALGMMILNLDNLDRAEECFKESLALFQRLGDLKGIMFRLDELGILANARGDYAAACSLLEESLTLCRKLGDQHSCAGILLDLMIVAIHQGRYTEARTLAEESQTLCRERGNKGLEAERVLRLGEVAFAEGNVLQAGLLLEESLQCFRTERATYSVGVAEVLFLQGKVALEQGDLSKALRLTEESLKLFKEHGDWDGITWVLSFLGKIALAEGNLTRARSYYEQSLSAASARRTQLELGIGLEGLASVVLVQGDAAWAVRLWGAAEVLREAIGAPLSLVERPGYEQAVATARNQLGEQAFTVAWAQGRTMTLEQVLTTQGAVTIPKATPTEPSSVPRIGNVSSPFDGLTPREVEVLCLLAQGLTSAQMAKQLVIGVVTVNFHVRSIYSKLGVSSRSAATRYAIEHHLL